MPQKIGPGGTGPAIAPQARAPDSDQDHTPPGSAFFRPASVSHGLASSSVRNRVERPTGPTALLCGTGVSVRQRPLRHSAGQKARGC